MSGKLKRAQLRNAAAFLAMIEQNFLVKKNSRYFGPSISDEEIYVFCNIDTKVVLKSFCKVFLISL